MLTPPQRQALDLASHTAIIANAGSGKTKVLVEKYLSILLEHPGYNPRDLVAITFTEQAARDLKRKILEEIDQRLKLQTIPGDVRRRLNEIRFLLGSAQISTIHAFCNQLLRTYPVEANVDASFGILFPPEDRIVLDEAIRSVFYRVLETAYANEEHGETPLLSLFRAVGRSIANEAMHSMMEQRSVALDVVQLFQKLSDEEVLARWKAAMEAFFESRFFGAVDVAWYAEQLRISKSTSQNVQTARAALSGYLGAKTLIDKVRNAIELVTAFHTKDWDRIRGGMVNKADHEALLAAIAPRLLVLERAQSVAEAYIDENITPEFEQSYVKLMRTLSQLFMMVLEEYENAKASHGLIDHDDSLLKTLALVENPDIAEELATRYKYILIDEYQDTDPVQYRIVEKITNKLEATTTLTIVGDPKQSIYSFRNAELQLFFDTVSQIRTAKRSKFVELQENFRLLPAPLAFINKVFDYTFSLPTSVESPENLPLIRARKTEVNGKVELLITGIEGEEEQLSEPELIARKINEIVTSGYEVEDNGVLRPAQYRDIAILQRSRMRQKEIEKALYGNHIPFSIYSGTGFYSRQEIVDILSYLQFLLDSTDDVALSGTLRSPYFAFDDADLLKIAVKRHQSDRTFWDIFSRIAATSDTPPHWQRAFAQLNENAALVGRISAYQLINKIYEESRIFGIYEQLRSGRQAIANMEKFASMALVGESSPYFGTYDFVERVILLADRDDQEAQAELRDDEDTVRIMTIHAAKGLEFPIVILPQLDRDLARKDSRRVDMYLDPELGAVMPFRDLEYQHWVYKLIRQGFREKDLEEEKRIFYVGATRARDYLILAGSVGDKIPSNSYLKWIEQALVTDVHEARLIRQIVRIDVYENEKVYPDDIVLEIPVTRWLPQTFNEHQLRRISKYSAEGNLSAVPESESQSRYSPTQLLHYIECPTKYYLRYGLGLPEESYLSSDSEAADLAEFIKGNLLGQLVHFMLEKADLFISNGSIKITSFDDLLKEGLEQLEIYDPATFTKYKDAVHAHVTRFITNDYGIHILQAKEAYKELNLRTMLNERQMLSGVIDRLYRNDEGAWEILDYKTDRTPVNKKKLDRYRFQMKFYAYLVSKFTETPVSEIKANLFFTAFGAREQFAFSAQDLISVGKELNTTVAKIRKDQEAESIAKITRNYDHCPECPYYNLEESSCIADGSGDLKEIQLKVRQDSLFQIEM